MSEQDLEVLITLDDPGEDDLEEDTFHLQAENAFPKRMRPEQRTEVIVDDDSGK